MIREDELLLVAEWSSSEGSPDDSSRFPTVFTTEVVTLTEKFYKLTLICFRMTYRANKQVNVIQSSYEKYTKAFVVIVINRVLWKQWNMASKIDNANFAWSVMNWTFHKPRETTIIHFIRILLQVICLSCLTVFKQTVKMIKAKAPWVSSFRRIPALYKTSLLLLWSWSVNLKHFHTKECSLIVIYVWITLGSAQTQIMRSRYKLNWMVRIDWPTTII